MKPIKAKVFYFIIFLALLTFTFRSLISNLSGNLPDWYDYPYLVWIINSNLEKFISLNFSGMFNTNILYPNPNNLLLTDTLFTQSFLALPARIFTANPILLFNFVFLITFILNYLASFLLWGRLFKKDHLAFLGATLTVFSPFFHAEGGHFQLQSYWPAFFCLYFLLKDTKTSKYKDLIVAGIFLTLQFLASVYLAVFLIIAIGIYFVADAIINRRLIIPAKHLLFVLGSFTLLASPVIYGYLKVEKQYNVQRNYGEYVFYSAHLSDYIFSRGYKSIIHNLQPINLWNSYNHHTIGGVALFPGFVLSILGLLGIIVSFRKPKNYDYFFLFLILIGIIFSFGPRVNFNGTYAEIPLPYHFLLKYSPLFEVIRAPSRWMFLAYVGFTFFTLKVLYQKSLKTGVFVLLVGIVLLEYLPLNIKSHSETYIQEKDQTLMTLCKNKPVIVLEVPVTHFDAGRDILEGLNYITKTILASTYHKCNLVNGYGSYDLPSIATLTNSLYDSSVEKDIEGFLSQLETSKAEFLVLNRMYMKEEDKAKALEAMIDVLKTEGYLLEKENEVFQIRVAKN